MKKHVGAVSNIVKNTNIVNQIMGFIF